MTRMRRCAALLAALALAGCGGEDEGETDAAVVPVAEGEAPIPPAVGEPPVGPGSEAVEGGADVTADSSAEYGLYLADRGGRPLYLFTADSAGQSTCYDQCAEMWPPLLAPQGTPTAGGPIVQSTMLGTTARRDGRTQVTYNGHPLYYYHEDQGAATPQGQDVHDSGGEWYLVTPRGGKVED